MSLELPTSGSSAKEEQSTSTAPAFVQKLKLTACPYPVTWKVKAAEEGGELFVR